MTGSAALARRIKQQRARSVFDPLIVDELLDSATVAALDAWAQHRGRQRPHPHPRTGKPTDFLFVGHGWRLSAWRIREGLRAAAAAAGLAGPGGQPLNVTRHQLQSISGRGRPALRVAARRAVWAALPNDPVMAARFTHLTTRDDNRPTRQQAHTACAAALLRWLHVVITRQVRWDPVIAVGGASPLCTAA